MTNIMNIEERLKEKRLLADIYNESDKSKCDELNDKIIYLNQIKSYKANLQGKAEKL